MTEEKKSKGLNGENSLNTSKKGESTMSTDEKEQKRISRREFVKGAAVGAAGVAAAGALASCTPEVIKETVEVPVEVIKEVPVEVIKEVVVNPLIPQKWDYEADVVIVGLGGAGASAAIEAHDKGAKVLVVEKQPYGDGYGHFSNSRMCGGIFHYPHPDGDRAARIQYLKAMMSGENLPWSLEGAQPHVSDEMAEMFADLMMESRDWLLSIDPDLDADNMPPGGWEGTPAFTMYPGAMESRYGYRVSARYKEYSLSDPDRLADQSKHYKSAGEAWMWALIEEGIRKQRPEITLLYSTPAKRLIKQANGEIIGVIAESEGKEIACKARKAVILCAGGLEYSVAMRRAFLEGEGVRGYGFYGSPDNRGEGIRMAEAVGAALAKPAKCASRFEPAAPSGRAWDECGLKQGLSNTFSRPGNIVIDNIGNRFIDEYLAVDGTRPYRYQSYKEVVRYNLMRMCYTRQPSWQICDETVRAARRLVGGRCVSTNNPRLHVPWAEDNLDAIEKGWVLKGDTIEELAAKIKAYDENRNLMEVETLVETVNNWNSYCAAGEDLEFGRRPDTMGPIDTPPFYALPLYPGGSNTKGGIDADAQRRVLDWDYKPIPRLYAAGEIASVFKFVYQGGGNVTECMVCGRAAGRNAAKETNWS